MPSVFWLFAATPPLRTQYFLRSIAGTNETQLSQLRRCARYHLRFVCGHSAYLHQYSPRFFLSQTIGEPAEIPPVQWYLSPCITVFVGGVLPFGVIFVELFFILSSLWLDQYVYTSKRCHTISFILDHHTQILLRVWIPVPRLRDHGGRMLGADYRAMLLPGKSRD